MSSCIYVCLKYLIKHQDTRTTATLWHFWCQRIIYAFLICLHFMPCLWFSFLWDRFLEDPHRKYEQRPKQQTLSHDTKIECRIVYWDKQVWGAQRKVLDVVYRYLHSLIICRTNVHMRLQRQCHISIIRHIIISTHSLLWSEMVKSRSEIWYTCTVRRVSVAVQNPK